LRSALEQSSEPAGDTIATLAHDLALAKEEPRLSLLHQPEEGQVTGERLDDGLDHPRQRDGRGELLRLDTLEPPDQKIERAGDDAEVEILLGREVTVERALADPRGFRDVVHADDVVRPGGEDTGRGSDDVLTLRRLSQRARRGLHPDAFAPGLTPERGSVGG